MRKIIVLLLIVAIGFTSNQAQAQSNTLYFMDGIHQSTSINPAYQNKCNGYLALPGISGPYVEFANTGFTFNDVIRPGTGLQKDSFIIDINNLKSKLGKSNYLLMNADVPLLGFGFWARNSYMTFSITNKTRARFGYPKGLLEIANNEAFIGTGNPLLLNDIGPEFINYNEFALGFSKQITHRLIIGGKVKILTGNAAMETSKNDIKFITSEIENDVGAPYSKKFEADIQYNISAPVDFTYDENGLIDEAEFADFSTSQVISTKNMGLALDFGASYLFNDKITFYGSVTDLGFIGWKNNTSNISLNNSFTFSGVTLDSVWTDSDYDEFEELGDSIEDFFKFSNSDSKFRTFLNTNIFLGATYEVAPVLKMGLLSKTFFYDRKIHQGVTLSANLQPTKWFATTLSYSIMHRDYKNIGLGASLKMGPVQLYFVTDYLNAAMRPKNNKAFNAQFGLNMYFGCGKRQNFSMIKNKKPEKDIDFM